MNPRLASITTHLVVCLFGAVLGLAGCRTRAESPTSTPKPPPVVAKPATRVGQILQELLHSGKSFTNSYQNCEDILKTEDWCNIVRGVVPITHLEWEQLFPKTRFYLVKQDAASHEEMQRNDSLIIEQDGRRYTDKTFDLLLDANGIVIKDNNRELIARALALLTVPDRLESEIRFTGWSKDTTPTPSGFEDCLTGWARLQGLVLRWCFIFIDPQYRLIAVGPEQDGEKTGDYIDVPLSSLHRPAMQYYYFLRK